MYARQPFIVLSIDFENLIEMVEHFGAVFW